MLAKQKICSAAPSDKPASGPRTARFHGSPYALDTEECNILLKGIVMGPVVTDDAVIVVKRSGSAPAGWGITMSRKYGETAVDYIGHS